MIRYVFLFSYYSKIDFLHFKPQDRRLDWDRSIQYPINLASGLLLCVYAHDDSLLYYISLLLSLFPLFVVRPYNT